MAFCQFQHQFKQFLFHYFIKILKIFHPFALYLQNIQKFYQYISSKQLFYNFFYLHNFNNMQKFDILLIVTLVIFGACNTIILTLQNAQRSNNNVKFFHPFIQCVLMEIGQMICLPIYLLFIRQKSQKIFQKPKPPILFIIFLGVLDVITTLLAYTALNMVPSSVWQISRGGVIATTAILSYIFLTKKITKGMIIGCLIALIGITSVQLVNIFFTDQKAQGTILLQIIGIVLLLLSLFTNAFQLCLQKWLFEHYSLHPLKLVGLQGLFGLILAGFLTFGFQFVPCPWSDEKSCVKVDGQLYLENFNLFFDQLSDNIFLIILIIGLIFSIGISVPIAVTISKRISPISRSLADVCRTSIIWIVGIAITITIGDNSDDYKLENLDVLFNILKFIGFALLILGTMIYHNLLPFIQTRQSNHSLLLSDSTSQPIYLNGSLANRKNQDLM